MEKKIILDCHKSIIPYIHHTPVLSSTFINELTNSKIFFKCENFQRMGAFKMRGATNAILQLGNFQREKGVVTHSSGNFAQALSLAAKSLGVKAFIVMPNNAPKVKIEAVKGYGGIVTLCEPNIVDREATARNVSTSTGATFIHPSNDLDVIIGNATACLELLEEYPNLEIVVAPVGGGGLIAGTALSTHYFRKDCKVIGAEPSSVDDAYRSLKSGKIEKNETTNTIADGLKTQLGTINFPIIQQYINDIITVEENEIINAMRMIYERLKIVVEPSSAVALAAVLKNENDFRNKNVGIILSGGNVDLSKLPF
ncbi:pyridoxal-phosphate dependent enzyme [Subsaxibacter sp. CAU 1640]|uniref:pyridoxal-phosphate dependent enzyme n=1 Tax=Subsaxibacter sp. CAU 1640 TaxID=2933271 RepID=UPI002005F81A|nr:pyridoxal-phosphate dependent enzyme [Subsaxibacter sp. CAU 1640]MCK7590246.1 pyridoxal-phosphate dependent enzyme [Subsaxibacter sp. CAU 1640]